MPVCFWDTILYSKPCSNSSNRDDESPGGNWSSMKGFNSSIDSSIKEDEYEDQFSPEARSSAL